MLVSQEMLEAEALAILGEHLGPSCIPELADTTSLPVILGTAHHFGQGVAGLAIAGSGAAIGELTALAG